MNGVQPRVLLRVDASDAFKVSSVLPVGYSGVESGSLISPEVAVVVNDVVSKCLPSKNAAFEIIDSFTKGAG